MTVWEKINSMAERISEFWTEQERLIELYRTGKRYENEEDENNDTFVILTTERR